MKVTSKQADATLAKLTNVMHRNTALAVGQKEASPAASGPVNTYAPQPVARRASRSALVPSTGIRLHPDDHAKIREVIQAGLALQENLAISDAIRLALKAYDPRRLTGADIAQVRARDGRFIGSKGRGSQPATVAQ